MADHLFAAGKPPESGIAGKQGAAGLVREGQCEGVGQRESGDSLAILCRLADSRAVEVEDLEAHGAQVIAAVWLQLEPVKEIGNAEFEAQGEGCGVERATFEVDEHGRVRYYNSIGHSSLRGCRGRQVAVHVLIDFDDGDVKQLGCFRLADGAFGEGAQTEPLEAVRLFTGHGAVFLVGGRTPSEAVELFEQGTVGG